MNIIFNISKDSVTYFNDNNPSGKLREVFRISTESPLIIVAKLIENMKIHVVSGVISIIGIDTDVSSN